MAWTTIMVRRERLFIRDTHTGTVRAGCVLLVGLDGCEVRLCGPCAFVTPGGAGTHRKRAPGGHRGEPGHTRESGTRRRCPEYGSRKSFGTGVGLKGVCLHAVRLGEPGHTRTAFKAYEVIT